MGTGLAKTGAAVFRLSPNQSAAPMTTTARIARPAPIVKAGFLPHNPECRTQCAVGKRVAARRLVCQFNALACVRKNDRVVAHDVTAANGMNADFRRCALADDARATVPRRLIQLQFAHVRENSRERFCRAARRVFFQTMMHLDHFEVEAGAKNFRRLAREPEQRVDTGGKIGRPNNWDCRFLIADCGLFRVRMTGGSDDDRLFVFRAQVNDARCRVVRTEINHHVALADDGAQIVAGINLPDNFERTKIRRAGDERLPHAAFYASDDYLDHTISTTNGH